MLADKRYWRTADGRLVLDGDPAAAVLAYAENDVISPADQELLAKPEKPKTRKTAEKPRR